LSTRSRYTERKYGNNANTSISRLGEDIPRTCICIKHSTLSYYGASFSSKSMKESLSPVMWNEYPLYKYHTDPNALESMHAIKVKSSSNCETRASPVADPTTLLFFFFCGQLVVRCPCFVIVKKLHFGQIQLLDFRLGFWMEFIPFPFPSLGSQRTILFIIML
jgi:hypothetical protein